MVLSHTYSGHTVDLSFTALMRIGKETNDLIDLYELPDTVVHHLCTLVCTVCSSRWECELCRQAWGLDREQARRMSAALLTDIMGKKVCGSFLILRDALIDQEDQSKVPEKNNWPLKTIFAISFFSSLSTLIIFLFIL